MAQWFYLQKGQQQGPVSSKEIKELAAIGSLNPEDLLWREGMKEWVPASNVKDLFTSTPQAEVSEVPHNVIPQASATPDPLAMLTSATEQESVPPTETGRRQKKPSRGARTTGGTQASPLRSFLTPKRIALGGVVLAALLLVVLMWAMSGGGGASYGPGSENRIVGTWKQHWEDGVSHVVRFTKEGTLVVTQAGRTDGFNAEDVGKYSISNGELTAYGKFSGSGTASIEFTSADEMIVGQLDKDVYLGACNLDGTWKRIKEGSPEALVDGFFDQIKGAWLNVKENGQKLTISKDAVVLEDTGGRSTRPCTIDASKKAITFLIPDKNITYVARLGEDGKLTVLKNGTPVQVMRRKRWGEGMKFTDDREGASASRMPEKNPGETVGEYYHRLNPTNDPAVESLIKGGTYSPEAARNIRNIMEGARRQ